MNPQEKYYENIANTIIENLKKRQMEGYYCKSSAEAVELATSFITPDSTVSFGGSVTLNETGLLPLLQKRKDIQLLDRTFVTDPEKINEIYAKAFTADTYFMSTNAITLEGELVNIDGNGNRVAALIWGPKQVIILAGMNKVCSNVEDAYHRVKNIAAPPNCVRLNRNTPCSVTGICGDCFSPDSICSNTVVTRRSGKPSRIKIILIGETLGY